VPELIRPWHTTFGIADTHESCAGGASSSVHESASAALSALLDSIHVHELLPCAVRSAFETVRAAFGTRQLPASWLRHKSLPLKLIRAHVSDESVLALVDSGSLDGEDNSQTLLDCAVSVAIDSLVDAATSDDVQAVLSALNAQLTWLYNVHGERALRAHHEAPLCEVACKFLACHAQGLTAPGLNQLFAELVKFGVTKVSRPTDIVRYWALLRSADGVFDTDDEAVAVGKAVDAVVQLAAVNRDLAWKLALHQTLEPTLNRALRHVVCAIQGQCRLLPATQILDESGDVVPVNETGRRIVARIDNQVGSNLYLKIRPELPGVESMVRELGRLLFGTQSVPHVELARWMDVDHDVLKADDPVLLSQGVPGPTLHTVLKLRSAERDAVLRHLDPHSISEAIILAMLTMPEDGKPDNYICEPLPNGSYRLVGIDNDRAFAPPFCSSKDKDEAKLVVKCVLFCMDHMHHTIHTDVRDALCAFDPLDLVQKWLSKLEDINSRNRALYECDGDSASARDLWSHPRAPTVIGVPFPPGAVSKLCHKLRRLQLFLGQRESCTHMEILFEIEPLLAVRYTRASTTDDLWTRFNEIDGSGFEVVDDVFITRLDTQNNLAALLGMLKSQVSLVEMVQAGTK
jgi:hypothetical protein